MYININGKITKVTKEEYDRLVEQGSIPAKGPASKMDELIAAVNSLVDAVKDPTADTNTTYTLTQEGNILKLTGSDGSVNTVEVSDSDTTYTFSIEGSVITITDSDGNTQSITLPEYAPAIISQSWDAQNRNYGITLTDNGEESTIELKYHLVKDVEANQIVLMADDKEVDRIQLAQDQDTKYRLEKVDNELRLIPNDGSEAIVVTLDDDLNTLYTISFDPVSDELKLQANDDSLPQIISLSKFADAEAVEEALAYCADKEETEQALAGKVDNDTLDNYAKKSDLPDVSGFATKTELTDAVEPLAKKTDIPDVTGFAEKTYVETELAKKADATAIDSLATKTELNDGLATKADKSSLNEYATIEAMNSALETKANKSDIPSIEGLVSEQALETALEPYAKSADVPSIEGLATTQYVDTELAKKADTTALESLATKAELEPLATTEVMNTELAKKADKAKLLNNDYLYNKVDIGNGGYSLIFNESDGGGSQISNKAVNVISYVGVSDGGPTGIAAQIYSKYISDAEGQVRNEGSRLNINPNGMYYTTKKTDGKFTAEDELATKKDLPSLDGYATTEDVNEATEVVSDNSDAQIAALKSQIDVLTKALKAIKTPDVEEVEIAADVVEADKDVAVNGGDVNGVVRTITAKSVDMADTTTESARLAITAADDVSITGLSSSGNLAKGVSNAAISINNSGDVTIKDCIIGQTGYNTIEIGLAADTAPKNVVIDNVYFEGKLANNAISIFRHQKNAEIVISNCVFVDCSNPIRLSNATNQPCKVKLINCEFRKWEEGKYAGALLLQDYTSSSAEEAVTENRFHNIIVEFINCTKPDGEK
ncbi:MAG: right-handed parallel beta-helix repeat-containing protein, partial [Bacilli bacterium]|nr:right-handed parallel beta-helix repeat-containing protein [Bacilli bacterium]